MNIIGLFLKEPISGQVKTRLVSEGINQEAVLNLYKAFLEDTLNLAQEINAEKKWAFISPGASEEFFGEIREKKFETYDQVGDDLGDRIAHFFQTAFHLGAQKVVLIGTDAPSLPKENVVKAFEILDKKNFVLGPSKDGGYYLIGMKKFIPQIFKEIDWSTDKVLNQTLNILSTQKELENTFLLPYWYDVDVFADLQMLYFHLKTLKQDQVGFFPAATFQALSSVSQYLE